MAIAKNNIYFNVLIVVIRKKFFSSLIKSKILIIKKIFFFENVYWTFKMEENKKI